MADFYISDLHFAHKNCMAFDNRPFKDSEECDKAMIDNWNNVVNISDTTYVLGDVSWANVTTTIDILNNLNSNKVLIVGNHDNSFLKNKRFRDCFIDIDYYKEQDIGNGKRLILSHYPIPTFNGQFRGNHHFYGHVHNTAQWNMIEHIRRMQEQERGVGTCNAINVGAMMPWMNYTPRTFAEIIDGYDSYKQQI